MVSYQAIVDKFKLEPHPEGGFFRETYRSLETIPAEGLPDRFGAVRSISTAIYFLIPRDAKSHLHRIKSDEVWHFYGGGPLLISQIFEDGRTEEVTLGPDYLNGQLVQYVVPAGCWFGSRPAEDSEFSFVGCTVAPGFDFRDFEMARRGDLLGQFPKAEKIILALTEA